MGVRLSTIENKVALFDSVSGWAFGPVFDDELEADEFVTYAEKRLNKDIRMATDNELGQIYAGWLNNREEV